MKSPLKDRSLRNHGQSLDRYLLDIVFDESIIYILAGTLVCFYTFNNWVYYFTQTVLNPWAVTFLAAVVVVYCLYKTKPYSKPAKGDARIVYTGDTLIHHNGFKDDKPLVQVKAEANWLKQLIKESTGRDFDVKKVVLFPGWFVEPTAESKQSDVWVLNPDALPAFIANSRKRLVGEDLSLVAYHFSRFVRAVG